MTHNPQLPYAWRFKAVVKDCDSHEQYVTCSLMMSSACGFSYAKKEAELVSSQARLKDLEALLNNKEASLATSLSEKNALEVMLVDIQAQLREVCTALISLVWDFYSLKSYTQILTYTPVVVGGRSGLCKEAVRWWDFTESGSRESLPEPDWGARVPEELVWRGKWDILLVQLLRFALTCCNKKKLGCNDHEESIHVGPNYKLVD